MKKETFKDGAEIVIAGTESLCLSTAIGGLALAGTSLVLAGLYAKHPVVGGIVGGLMAVVAAETVVQTDVFNKTIDESSARIANDLAELVYKD